MTTHSERAQRFYGGPPAPKPVERKLDPTRSIYPKDEAKFVGLAQTIFDKKLTEARARLKHDEVSRLTKVQNQAATYCEEMNLTTRQGQKFLGALVDCISMPRSERKGLLAHDEAYFADKFGAGWADVVNGAAAQSGKLLANKPELASAARDSGALLYRDVIDPVLEATASKPAA